MKCLNCGAEWENGANAGAVPACPVCGTPQDRGAVCDSLDSGLLAACQYLGDARCRNGQSLSACFADFAPGLRREARMLRVFLKCEGHTALLDAKAADPSGMRTAAERVVRRMREELLEESFCRSVVGAFCRAIGCDLGPEFDGGFRNPWSASGGRGELREGTVLCGEYVVRRQLELSSGDADLYVCGRGEELFVARVGQDPVPFRQDVVAALLKLDHPGVSRLCAAGSCGFCPVEIYPFYENGSLQGETFREDAMVQQIVPELNEGLRALHRAGILHRGIRTSNVALSADGEHICLMISKRTILERSAAADDGAAPETERGSFTEASDYYALGMVLYELYCGYAPTAGSPAGDGKSGPPPFPKEMPIRLQALITGLTCGAADERWGYGEVRRWVNGEMPPVPGGSYENVVWIREYDFLGQKYTDLSGLSAALSGHWKEGKEELLHGRLTSYFRSWNLELYRKTMAAEEEAGRQEGGADLAFWRLLYQIDPARKDFFWRGNTFESLSELGRRVLDHLWDRDWDRDPDDRSCYTDILEQKLLTKYAALRAPNRNRLQKQAAEIEAFYEDKRSRGLPPDGPLYLMGYQLSGQKFLLLDGNRIRTTGELAAYMRSLLSESFKRFEALCHRLADVDGNLDQQLEAWLIAIGKQDELDRWSLAMNA